MIEYIPMDDTEEKTMPEAPPPKASRRWLVPPVLAAITLVGLALRLFNLGSGDYTAQTALSLAILQGAPEQIWQAAAQAGQPGGYYLLLHLFGSSNYPLLALPSLLAGTLLIPLVYALASMVAGRGLALLAAAFTAGFPPAIVASQEIGPLAALMLSAGLLVFFTHRWLDADRTNRANMVILSALYILTAITGLSLSYYFVYVWLWTYLWVIVAQQVLRYQVQRKAVRFIGGGLGNDLPGPLFSWIWSGAQLIVLTLYFPQLAGIQRWASGRTGTSLSSNPLAVWTGITLGPSVPRGMDAPLLVLLFALALAGGWYLFTQSRRTNTQLNADRWLPSLLLCGALIFPLASVWLGEITTGKAYNLVYWGNGYGVVLPVAIAAGVWALRRLALPAALIAGILVAGAFAEGINAQYSALYRPPYHNALAELNEQLLPGDALLVYGDIPQVQIAPQMPPLHRYSAVKDYESSGVLTDTVALLPGELFAPDWSQLIRQHPRVWTLSLGSSAPTPQNEGILVDEKTFGAGDSALTLRSYTQATPLDAISGYAVGPLRLLVPIAYPATRAGGTDLPLRLHWTVERPVAINYRMVLTLIDSQGHTWQSRDRLPLGNGHLYPTSQWKPGQAVIDDWRYPLPPGAPPGEYHLQLGVYDPANNRYLNAGEKDRLDLGTIQIGPTLDSATIDLPVQQRMELQIDPTEPLTLLGYSLDSILQKPGESFNLDLFWRADTTAPAPVKPSVRLVSSGGQVVAQTEADFPYPLSQWQANQIVRQHAALLIPADAPDGLYHLQIALRQQYTNLSDVRIQGRERNFEQGNKPQYVQEARFGTGIELLGYDLPKQQVEPGGSIKLTLHLHALEKMATSYKVTVQVLRMTPEGWSIAAQQDKYPCDGDCPTTGWVPGEYLEDGYTLTLKPDAAPGEYLLLVAFYDESKNGQRLPVSTSATELFLQQKIVVARRGDKSKVRYWRENLSTRVQERRLVAIRSLPPCARINAFHHPDNSSISAPLNTL